jgi:hypothetical protein
LHRETRCQNCGDELSAERTELGFTYCTRPECVDACLEPAEVVALGVNKAADQYLLRRHLDLPEPAARTRASDAPDPDDSLGALNLAGRPSRPVRSHRQRRNTAERIAALEKQLDARLAKEHDPARRRKLLNDHNATLRRLNIRYRRSSQRRA